MIEIWGEGELQGYLKEFEASDEMIRSLAAWRNQHKEWFLYTGEVTPASTRDWLESVKADPLKRLYGIYTSEGICVGTYGYTVRDAQTVELGNLLRGRPGGHKNLIRFSEVALLKHLFQAYSRVTGEVFSHNAKVIKLHISTGFKITGEVGLIKVGDLFVVADTPKPEARLSYILNTLKTFEAAIRYENSR